MINLLWLNYEFPPLGGGAGNATQQLLEEFANDPDVRIDLVTSSAAHFHVERFAERISIHFLDIHKSGSLQSQSTKELLRYSWQAWRYCQRLKRMTRYDGVHAFFGVPCGYLAYRLGLPYLVSLRGSDVPGHNPAYRMHYRMLRGVIRTAWRHAVAVVANSEDLRQEALHFFAREMHVIPNGVDAKFFMPQQHNPGDPFRILFVGRLHRVKNIDLLLRSYAAFHNAADMPRTELWIVGEGNEAEHLKNLAQTLALRDHVHFLGCQRKDQLRSLYQQSSLFALLSENEGMSNTLLEAMACGLPVLATRTGGSAKLIAGIELQVEQRVDDVVRALRYAYTHASALQSIGERNHASALGMSWAHAAQAYRGIYQQFIRQS